MTNLSRRAVLATALAAAIGGAMSVDAASAGDMRIAFGDLPGIESIQTLTAIERAKERGVNVELIILNDEDLAAQAIVGNQADVGVGAPYTLIQKAGVPIRLFAQISTLRFFPVVNSEFYKEWKDLDGQDVAVQARGSGTEAVMLLMAKTHGIKLGSISYVPGSEVRRNALIQGTLKASIVDAANRRALEAEAPGKFIVLPVDDLSATDEGLFATADYLKNNAADVDILVEELMKTAREITENPAVAVEFRNKYKLLPDLGAEADAEIAEYYKETAGAGSLVLNGGGAEAAADDFAFFSLAGQIEGDPASLKVDDFWDVAAIDRAVAKLGKK
ncbi:MAG: ABC transporter substrate-binding protein [Mesorhizobium sp.]|uniref:ABC transporter substrate-binding protein n=1 Tax=Mesorhizobium sp. TaxID=1871066 RepID=UPI000FE7FB64|nr:ABC transporter substrate-binding protein [Mesorhizobium sp.]RWE22522.1 MAG: ABC transporter substrate-binding protein [Mesorhizobium sp.]TGT61519.1 ABC transporter substrate-binding protein [Mesorhizobium sp. M00.F.Ca.ET.170.01.1.1]